MKWQKSSQGLIDLFESVIPGPPAVKRKMFGYPAGFVNGNMFMGLFQESMILRLPTGPREEFLKVHNAKIFEPMAGRPMREYAAVPQSVMRDKKELSAWVARAFEYGASLKPKSRAANPTKSRSKPKMAKRSQRYPLLSLELHS
jgi:TfoX/Sxy family transcriptional regulator of competence genes